MAGTLRTVRWALPTLGCYGVGDTAKAIVFDGRVPYGQFHYNYTSQDERSAFGQTFWGVPQYGRPPDYAAFIGQAHNYEHIGTGELLFIATTKENRDLNFPGRWHETYAVGPVLDGGTYPDGPLYSIGCRAKSWDDDWHDTEYTSLTKLSSTQFKVNGANARRVFNIPFTDLSAWQADTAYSVGAQRLNDPSTLPEAKIYECVTAGTSASSGGPTGTGTGIVDGTAVWDYITTIRGRLIRMYPGPVTAEVSACTYDDVDTTVTVINGTVPDSISGVDINWARVHQESMSTTQHGGRYKCVGDWDGGNDTRYRTEMRALTKQCVEGQGSPYLSTRWVSVSMYLPSNWYTEQTGWSFVTTLQYKPVLNSGSMSPPFSIGLQGTWHIPIFYNTIEDPAGSGWSVNRFSENYIVSSEHYPDDAVSLRALQTVTKGGWTHFVYQHFNDGRTSTNGGRGFIRMWKRDGSGPWIEMLDYYATASYPCLFPQNPLNIYQPAIGYHLSNYAGNIQLEQDPSGNIPPEGRTIYYANVKTGNSLMAFADMTHDGSDVNDEPNTFNTEWNGVTLVNTDGNYHHFTNAVTDAHTRQAFTGTTTGATAKPRLWGGDPWSTRPPSIHKIKNNSVPAWQASQSGWVVGDACLNDGGKVYKVASITTGTTGSSGGPTGTGTGIVDGGVTWDYMDASHTGDTAWDVSVATGVNGPRGTANGESVLRVRRKYNYNGGNYGGVPQCGIELTHEGTTAADMGMLYVRLTRRIKDYAGPGAAAVGNYQSLLAFKTGSAAGDDDRRLYLSCGWSTLGYWQLGLQTSDCNSAWSGGNVWQGRGSEMLGPGLQPRTPDEFYVNDSLGLNGGSGERWRMYGPFIDYPGGVGQVDPDWSKWSTIVLAFRLQSIGHGSQFGGADYNWVAGNKTKGWVYVATAQGTTTEAASNGQLKTRMYLDGPNVYGARLHNAGAQGMLFCNNHYGPGMPTDYDYETGRIEVFDHWPDDHPWEERPLDAV